MHVMLRMELRLQDHDLQLGFLRSVNIRQNSSKDYVLYFASTFEVCRLKSADWSLETGSSLDLMVSATNPTS